MVFFAPKTILKICEGLWNILDHHFIAISFDWLQMVVNCKRMLHLKFLNYPIQCCVVDCGEAAHKWVVFAHWYHPKLASLQPRILVLGTVPKHLFVEIVSVLTYSGYNIVWVTAISQFLQLSPLTVSLLALQHFDTALFSSNILKFFNSTISMSYRSLQPILSKSHVTNQLTLSLDCQSAFIFALLNLHANQFTWCSLIGASSVKDLIWDTFWSA